MHAILVFHVPEEAIKLLSQIMCGPFNLNTVQRLITSLLSFSRKE